LRKEDRKLVKMTLNTCKEGHYRYRQGKWMAWFLVLSKIGGGIPTRTLREVFRRDLIVNNISKDLVFNQD